MKKLYLLFLLLLFSVLSCTTDDTVNNQTQKLFKKIERYKVGLFFDTTINYNSNNKIQSIIINKYLPAAIGFTRTITVEYSGNSVKSIRDVTNNPNTNNNPVEDITYEASAEDNVFFLTAKDVRIEIYHRNGYVDLLKKIRLEDSAVFKRSFLTRDSNDNLISYTFSGGNVVNRYSNFDYDKKVDPRGIVIDVAFREFIDIFNLKLTKNNPRTKRQDILSSVGRSQTYTYEYDEEGFITRTYDQNKSNYTDTFYIER